MIFKRITKEYPIDVNTILVRTRIELNESTPGTLEYNKSLFSFFEMVMKDPILISNKNGIMPTIKLMHDNERWSIVAEGEIIKNEET